MLKKIEVDQAEIEVGGYKYTVTHIPTATSGMWYTIHDACEVWSAVAIDLNGGVVGWHNEPEENWKEPLVEAIKKAFGIPVPG